MQQIDIPLDSVDGAFVCVLAEHRVVQGEDMYEEFRTVNAAGAASVELRIGSVRNKMDKEIPNGGTTVSTEVTLHGKATPHRQVKVLDGATSNGRHDVNRSGNWTAKIPDLSVGAHRFEAQGLYGDPPVSNSRSLSVAEPFEYTSQFGPGDTQFDNWTRGAAGGGAIVTYGSTQLFDYYVTSTRTRGSSNGEQLFTHFYLAPGTYIFSYKFSFSGNNPQGICRIGMSVGGKYVIPPESFSPASIFRGRLGLFIVDGDISQYLRVALTAAWETNDANSIRLYQIMIKQAT